jgi:flagellar hook-length control protein FliK
MTLAPASPTASRPAAGPLTTSGYAAQLASQETPADATAAPTLDLSKTAADAPAADKMIPEQNVAGVMADADKALVAATSTSQDPVAAPTTTDHSVRATAQTEAVAQRGPRPAAVPVVEQVAVRITKALADGVDRINVKLNPADLGQIDIRMEIGPDGRFNAVFAADRPQTVELLQRDARELARSLQDAGLRADAGSLSFNLRGQNQGQQNSGSLTAFDGAGLGTNGGEVLPEAMPLPANLYNGSQAANGRVDIRV